jgi:hypothetical protein
LEKVTMKFSLFTEFGAGNSRPIFEVFAKSLKNAGHEVVYNTYKADVAVIWSVLFHGAMEPNRKVFDRFREQGKNVLILEVGGIQRNKTWKIGLNGINRKHFPYLDKIDKDPDRPKQFKLNLKPWKPEGDYILICGQHAMSLQWQGLPLSMENWIYKIVNRIRGETDRKIILRPHPRWAPSSMEVFHGIIDGYQIPRATGNQDEADLKFDNAYAVVNWSSNPGMQPMGNDIRDFSNIESPNMPDREEWLIDYAHTEFTVKEIESGLALDLVSKGFM